MKIQLGEVRRGDARCLYCRDDVDEDATRCECEALYHPDCAQILHTCAVPGCARVLPGCTPQPVRADEEPSAPRPRCAACGMGLREDRAQRCPHDERLFHGTCHEERCPRCGNRWRDAVLLTAGGFLFLAGLGLCLFGAGIAIGASRRPSVPFLVPTAFGALVTFASFVLLARGGVGRDL